MEKIILIGILLLALVPWPVMVAVHKMDLLKGERNVWITYVATTATMVLVTFFFLRRYFKNVDPFIYLFAFLVYDGSYATGYALEVDGILPTSNVSKIFSDMDPSLKTAHGLIVVYWHGIVHSLLSVAIIALYIHRESHREVSLYWAGSFLNSLAVAIPVLFTGAYSSDTIGYLNMAAGIYPLCVLFYYMHKRPVQARTFLPTVPIWKRPVDLVFFLYFLASCCIVVFRGLAVIGGNIVCMKDYVRTWEPYLKDPSAFPKFQAVTYEYVFQVYYMFTMYGLLFPGQHWMADWSLVHAGAASQAQFSYIAGSLHTRTTRSYRAPQAGAPAVFFWSLNLIMFIVPHVFAWWCQRDPESFGRTYTVDLATPSQMYSRTNPRRSARLQQKSD